jgi:hypothetical protein
MKPTIAFTLGSLIVFALPVIDAAAAFTPQIFAIDRPSASAFSDAAQSKCSAGDAMTYEGTDESALSAKCKALLHACINEKLPCEVRKRKCQQYEHDKSC